MTKKLLEILLTPGEVAEMFRVDPKTVTRWANEGKLASIRTLGGHRRFKKALIDQLLEGNDESGTPGKAE